MNPAGAAPSPAVKRELARLLLNFRAHVDERNRHTHRGDVELNTTVDCSELNVWFRERAGLDREWPVERTWKLLKDRLTVVGETRAEILAVQDVLRLHAETRNLDRIDRRVEASRRLCPVYSKNDFRLWKKDTAEGRIYAYRSTILRKMVDAVVLELEEASMSREVVAWKAQQSERASLRSVASPGSSTEDTASRAREQLADRLDRSPRYYPPHLTPSELVKLLLLADVPFAAWKPGMSSGAMPLTDLAQLQLDRRTVILGGPGAGKSTFLRAYASMILRSETARPVVFVRLVDYLEAAAKSSPRDVGEMVRILAKCGASYANSKLSKQQLQVMAVSLQSRDDALFLLDGFDEVLDATDRQRGEELLDELEDLPASVVLTSRPSAHRARPEWVERWVEGTEDLFPRLIESWYGGQESARSVAEYAFKRNSGIYTVVKNPLLAGLVALLSGTPGALVSADGELDIRTSNIIGKAIELILERNWKHRDQPSRNPADALELAGLCQEAAWTMAVGDPAAPSSSAFSIEAPYQRLADAGIAVDRVIASDLFTGEVVGFGESEVSRQVIWVHRSFHDYFVGRRLAAWWKAEKTSAKRFLKDAIQHTAWLGSLGMMLEILSEDERSATVRGWLSLASARDPGNVIMTHLATILPRQLQVAHDVSAGFINRLVAADLLLTAQEYDPRFINRSGVIVLIAQKIESGRFNDQELRYLEPETADRIGRVLRLFRPVVDGGATG